MRNQVLIFLAGLAAMSLQEQFNEGFKLLRQSPGANQRTINAFNAQGFSSARLESVLHELKKLHSISEKDIALQVAAPAEQKEDPEVIQMTAAEPTDLTQYVYSDPQGKPLRDDDPQPVLRSAKEVFELAPADVKTEIKLREEFPFLNEPTCPDEMHLLTGKKLSHYAQYCKAHSELMLSLTTSDDEGNIIEEGRPLSEAEMFELAKTAVENFEANQDIYDELNHYKNTGEILGKHPVFADKVFKDKLDQQSVTEVNLRKSNLINYINRGTKNLETAKPEKIDATKQKIKDWERQLAMVNDWLKKNDKK